MRFFLNPSPKRRKGIYHTWMKIFYFCSFSAGSKTYPKNNQLLHPCQVCIYQFAPIISLSFFSFFLYKATYLSTLADKYKKKVDEKKKTLKTKSDRHEVPTLLYEVLVNVVQINHIQAPLIWFIFREQFWKKAFWYAKDRVRARIRTLIRRLSNVFRLTSAHSLRIYSFLLTLARSHFFFVKSKRGTDVDTGVFIEEKKKHDISSGGWTWKSGSYKMELKKKKSLGYCWV